MADPQETRQEQEARWATQRTAHDQEQQTLQQAARKRRTGRTWVIVGVVVFVLIVAGVAVRVLW